MSSLLKSFIHPKKYPVINIKVLIIKADVSRIAFQVITPRNSPKTQHEYKKQWWQTWNFLNFTFNLTEKFLRKNYFFLFFPEKKNQNHTKISFLPLEKKRELFWFWQKIVIMYDNNILTFLAFLCSVPAIGAEVSDLMILMAGRKNWKRFEFAFLLFSGFKATLEKVFLLTFVNFEHLSQSFILSECS